MTSTTRSQGTLSTSCSLHLTRLAMVRVRSQLSLPNRGRRNYIATQTATSDIEVINLMIWKNGE